MLSLFFVCFGAPPPPSSQSTFGFAAVTLSGVSVQGDGEAVFPLFFLVLHINSTFGRWCIDPHGGVSLIVIVVRLPFTHLLDTTR